jgi:3-phosphoshikimate 1-carboxyvinyltransferase
MDGDSKIHILGSLESSPYVAMTQNVMALFGVDTQDFFIRGGQHYHSPGTITVEGDWSNGAFWVAAKALGSDLEVLNLDPNSLQGDREAAHLLTELRENIVIDASDIPDLVPILAVTAAFSEGTTVITKAERLRIKESDRLFETALRLKAFGIDVTETDDGLKIVGGKPIGANINSANDHRIVMAFSVMAAYSKGVSTIENAEAINKSYPLFFKDFSSLGGECNVINNR